jgi:hypothetical protein
MKGTMVVPYIWGTSEKIGRIGKMRDMHSGHELCYVAYSETKSNNEVQETKNCRYSIPCECRKKCVGERGRPFNTRITRHKCNTKMGEISKSKTAEHVYEDHRIQWNKAEIIHKEENRIIRKLKESVFIRTTEQAVC